MYKDGKKSKDTKFLLTLKLSEDCMPLKIHLKLTQ